MLFSFNEIDEIKTFDLIFEMVWVLHLGNAEICHSVVFFYIWNCSEIPFLEVCKLTDLMAVKVGRFTDLGAVLVEYYRAKSSKGLNMQGLTHVLGKSKLLKRAYKVGGFTDLVAVFESHCSLCTCRELSEKWPRYFAEAMQFIVPTYLFFFYNFS